jgi:gamma-glutamylaminecyclotransferase
VFVYGTLRRGEGNHRLLEHVKLLASVKTAPIYTLISLGGCPGLLANGKTAITGELYEVDTSTLARLDELEGHPRLYQRSAVEIEDHPSAVAYFLPATRYASSPVIESGDWLDDRAAPTRRYR